MILVDSSVWIDYFRGTSTAEADALDRFLTDQQIIIGDIILLGVLQGFTLDREFASAKKLLTSLHILELGGREIAVEAANHYRFLRRSGITVRKTIDTIIATRCIHDRLPLLYSDRDFDPFVLHLGLARALAP